MMYRVTVMTGGREYLLHDSRDDEIQLIDPVVTLETGKSGAFEFRIAPTHPNKDKIRALSSEIRVYDGEEILFCGRQIGDESDFHNIGKATCEGELAYLLDSIQRPYEFTGSVADFFRQLLEVHNSQVEEKKRFEIGDVTVADSSPEARRSDTECRSTLAVMRSQLTEPNEGYLVVRRSDGRRYLDYVNDYGGINDQVIRFGENLLDMTRYGKPAGIITALIPYGETLESEGGEEEGRPVDIAGVNDGRDYIFDQNAVDAYGWIWGTRKFDGVLDPETLLQKARAYLQEAAALPMTLDLKALDLGRIDVDVKKLRLGCWTEVESVPHGIRRRFLLTRKTIHLDNPGNDEVILGQTLPTFTGAANEEQARISERIKRVAEEAGREINRKVENATQLITGGKGGYVVLDIEDPDSGEKTHPWRILIMDAPVKEEAGSVIQLNKNGLGFSTTGIAGPYRNAWTIDGNLVADFVTAGTMLADRIRGGTLELGGKGAGKDGTIRVLDADGSEIGRFDKKGIVLKKGRVISPTIEGGNAEFGGGLFYADDDAVMLGGFESRKAWGRNIFQSSDEKTGMSADPSETGQWFLWAGWNSDKDYAFAVNNLKEVHCHEIYVQSDQDFWQGRNLSAVMRELYERLNRLERGAVPSDE